jgi:hypothetical protein
LLTKELKKKSGLAYLAHKFIAEIREYDLGNRRADHVAPSIRQELALTSLTSGGRSVGIVRSRTQATEEKKTSFLQLAGFVISTEINVYSGYFIIVNTPVVGTSTSPPTPYIVTVQNSYGLFEGRKVAERGEGGRSG